MTVTGNTAPSGGVAQSEVETNEAERIAALGLAKKALDASKDLIPAAIVEMRKFPDLRNIVCILGRAELAIYNAYCPVTKRLYEQDGPNGAV